MDGIGRGWDRYQWVGAPANPAASNVDPVGEMARWSLDLWVGESSRGARPGRWVPTDIDTSGGFSGFGQADGGGQRWATGYRRQVLVPLGNHPDIDPSRATS